MFVGAYISYNAHFVMLGMILILVLAMQSFVEVTKYLFSLPDVQVVSRADSEKRLMSRVTIILSEHFSQDACMTSCKGGLAAN